MLNSGIEYIDHSWNPWIGCHKVSPGCDNCYMHREMRRFGQNPGTVRRTSPATWKQALRFGKGSTVFVCTWSDFFIEEADQWRKFAWRLIEQRPDVRWLLVTKRPERIDGNLPWGDDQPWPNVVGIVTAENQEMADLRIPILLRSNFAVRGVSVEPMLGHVDLMAIRVACGAHALDCACSAGRPCSLHQRLDWVICGGETGRGSRPMHPDWARSLRDQCQSADVPFFFKQWGEWGNYYDQDGSDSPLWSPLSRDLRSKTTKYVTDNGRVDGVARYGSAKMVRVGKKASGRLLDGSEWLEQPWMAKPYC